ncbi:F-box/WD repeat-containing protein 9-like isoform X2 [Temnothorax nylanderi]|uniref:F-box/WD repeat-containing protein 9-like isoform X2 n=1 Tax=Temnothorax nylanderi TaxID=102681 RepID=UPI003A8535D3
MCTIITAASPGGARPDKLFWLSSCFAIEKQIALWKQQDSMVKLINMYPHYIRAVLLMHGGTICIGGTEFDLVYWKRETPSYEIGNRVRTDLAHDGWIHGLTAIDNTIYSCGCDRSVKSWMLTNTSFVHQRTYEMPNEQMCVLSSCPQCAIIGGAFSGTIYVFDSRSSNNPISQYRPHIKRVTKLAMNTEYILSASLDKTVSVWDQRAGRTMKSITIPDQALPTCMSMRRDWVCVGDHKAKLHMLNLNNDFELVKSYSTEHTKGITEVHLTHGCLITSSIDGTVRISSLSDPPKPIATLRSKFKHIFSMDYLNDTLAVSGLGIEVWHPKLTCSTKHQ